MKIATKWVQVGIDDETGKWVSNYINNNKEFSNPQNFYNYAIREELARLEIFYINKNLLKSIPVTTNGKTTKILSALHVKASKLITKTGPFNSVSKILCYAARNEILRNSTLTEIIISNNTTEKGSSSGGTNN